METLLKTLADNWEQQAQEFRIKEIKGIEKQDLAMQYVNAISADRLEECAQQLRKLILTNQAHENHLEMVKNLINNK